MHRYRFLHEFNPMYTSNIPKNIQNMEEMIDFHHPQAIVWGKMII